MSHLKIIRGNFARQLLTCAKNGRKTKGSRIISHDTSSRSLATQTAPMADNKFLTSPYGEIEIGKETLPEFVFADVETWADKPSVTCGSTGRSYDYGMMRMMVERCATSLAGPLKLKPGERIGLILPNIPEFAVLIHGAMRAGLVVTFANPLYTPDEVRRQFADCNVKAIATIEMFMPVAEEVSKSLKDYKGTIWVGGEDNKVKGNFIWLGYEFYVRTPDIYI